MFDTVATMFEHNRAIGHGKSVCTSAASIKELLRQLIEHQCSMASSTISQLNCDNSVIQPYLSRSPALAVMLNRSVPSIFCQLWETF
eukprot:3956879-Amphidinium_carterae.1